MEQYFLIKPGQPIGMPLTIFSPFSKSLIRAKNGFVKNGTANFGRNIPTEICGPPPEVIPNIPVRRNRNGLFHLNSDRDFRNLWQNVTHPGTFEERAPDHFPRSVTCDVEMRTDWTLAHDPSWRTLKERNTSKYVHEPACCYIIYPK